MALDVAESLIHGVALRAPGRLADDDFAEADRPARPLPGRLSAEAQSTAITMPR